MQVPEAKVVIMQQRKDRTAAENVGVRTRKLELMFRDMINAVKDSQWDHASSDNELDREHKENYQQNVNWSGICTQTSQTLQATPPVLSSISRCLQAPLVIWQDISDSASAFSGASECSCRYGGAFRMLQDLTYSRVRYYCIGDRCAGLWESSWDHCAALRETWCCILTAVVLKVPSAQGMSSILFVFYTVTRFAIS